MKTQNLKDKSKVNNLIDREQEQEPTPETNIGGDMPNPELEERPPGQI